MTLHNGWDSFHCLPGKVESMECKVCGAKTLVERNKKGPTSFATAMRMIFTFGDHFWCPNHDQEWHEKVCNLKIDARYEYSDSIREILENDIKDILEKNAKTKLA